MPKPDFRSITVNEDFFDRFDLLYQKKKKNGTLDPGICSFTSFFTQQLEKAIKEKRCMPIFVSKIKYVPKEFTETKLVLKKYKP